jgi:RecA-family ATPase
LGRRPLNPRARGRPRSPEGRRALRQALGELSTDELWIYFERTRLRAERQPKQPSKLDRDIDAMFAKIDAEAEAKIRARIKAAPHVWTEPHEFPRRQWLHGRYLIRKFASLTVSAGGVGKSSLGIVEALEMVTGEALITNHKAEPLRVWIWNGEDPLEEIQRRIQAACKHYKIPEAKLVGRLFVNSGRDMPIVLASENRGGLVLATPLVEALKAEIRAREVDVLLIDPFVRCHRVSENDNGKINAVAEAWAEIADHTDSAIGLSHHAKKMGTISADGVRANRRSLHPLTRKSSAP